MNDLVIGGEAEQKGACAAVELTSGRVSLWFPDIPIEHEMNNLPLTRVVRCTGEYRITNIVDAVVGELTHEELHIAVDRMEGSASTKAIDNLQVLGIVP